MNRVCRTPARHGGFSLIEVMIAVVVLAIGFLALAALQASLARSSGEAKVRSHVAAMLTARMDELRGQQYDSAVTLPDDTCAGTVWVPAGFCGEVGIGALTTTQAVSPWSSTRGAASFTEGRPPAAGEPQFKRVTLTATWSDADNAPHLLSITSDISALALGSSLLPKPPGSSAGIGGPIVRTDNPAGPGVIPIAVGTDGDATSASNPRPEVIGRKNKESIVGTRFDVLTYSARSGEAVIQRRVETSVIKCDCQYGVGGTKLPVIYREAQWPAVWTGERYDVYKPDPVSAAPGASFASGPKADVEQSPLCQECCRDHHDTATANIPKFDPERVVTLNQAHEHYSPNVAGTLVIVPDTVSSDYAESCRLIRVDGFWRTAADTYSRHFGLLETQAVASVPAKTGAPSDEAATAYQTFVKDFLGQYTGEVATAPTTPQTADFLFNQEARGLNNPLSIAIDRPAPADERYLHGRGLYVDYLEKDALDKIKAVVQKCDKAECILPYLPFATINVTELAFWQPMIGDADGQSVLRVATGSSLISSPLQPTRGRTNALSSAPDAATADAVAKIGMSNAGMAAARGVDIDDEAGNRVDRQVFVVSDATPPGSGDRFSVQLAGLPQILDEHTQNDPAIAWAVGITDAGDCDPRVSATDPDPNDYACITYGSLGTGVSGSITLALYFRATTVATNSTDLFTQCHLDGVLTTVEPSIVQVPALENYVVSSATINGVDAPPMPSVKDGTRSETTTIGFTDIPVDALVTVTFATQTTHPGSPIPAEFVSCTATQANENEPVLVNNIVWDDSAWE